MTDDTPLHPAEERLLDAALAQHFAGAIGHRRAATPSWIVAAMVLLGLGVVVSVWVVTTSGGEAEAQQPEPLPLPPETKAVGTTEIEALPVATENLVAAFVDPRQLAVVTRLQALRCLRLRPEQLEVLGVKTGAHHASWRQPPVDLLQPIAQLAQLEILGLPSDLALTPEMLAPLAEHPTLRELELVRDAFTLDDAMVAALAKVPQLRSLDLHFVPLAPEIMRRLARLPLASLELHHCRELDADGWQALRNLHNLRRLSVKDWSWNVLPGRRVDPPGWRPTGDDLRLLQHLPHLRCLELLDCDVEDDQFAAMPDSLTTLHLVGSKLTPEGIGALTRLLALRELVFTTKRSSKTIGDLFAAESEDAANAFAAALRPLRLRSLDYRGALTTEVVAAVAAQRELRNLALNSKRAPTDLPTKLLGSLRVQRVVWSAPVATSLLDALAEQPDLRELELRADAIPDLTALVKATKLERLTLSQMALGNGIQAEVLAPLARSASLREILVNVSIIRGEPHPSATELQRAVGDRIRLRLQESEFTVKK